MAGMRFALAAIWLPVSAALAAEIPVSSTYGTTEVVCALYKEGGALAVVGNADDSAFVVSPSERVFLEGGCAPETVNGDDITLACYSQGEEWTSHASIAFDADGDILYFTDENGTFELHRCP